METLEEFKNSFSYGTRSDLLFKFLKNLSPDEAGAFLQSVLTEIGGALDSGDLEKLAALVFETQYQAYQQGPQAEPKWVYDDGAFVPLAKPLDETRIALLTSSGHFVEGEDPKPLGTDGMTHEEAVARIEDFLRDAPELAKIPVDTPLERLRVRHPGYDVRGALADANTTLPLHAMKKLVENLHPVAYSFVGAASQLRLKKERIPQWVEEFRESGIEAMVLVPV